MKPKYGFILIIILLLLGQVNNVWTLITHTENQLFRSIAITLEFCLVGILLFIEKKNLADFHLDRFTLIVLVIVCFFRMRFQVFDEVWLLSIIGIVGLTAGFILFANWLQIPVSNFQWAVIGFFTGVILALPISAIQLFSGFISTFQNNTAPIPFQVQYPHALRSLKILA